MDAPLTNLRARALLRDLFDVAVASADPARVLARHLPDKPVGRCIVVGAGKAAASMARALEAAWPDIDIEGVVVTRDGHSLPTRRIAVLEASHPVPDARSVAASVRMLSAVRSLGKDDLVIALISGGGSATLALPAEGLTLDDKIQVHRALLNSGAPIGEMNRVRGALSAIKSGRLALAAAPARVVTLVISDVPGDHPEQIASGPTIGPPPSRREALAIVRRHGLRLPSAVEAYLQQPDPVGAPEPAWPVDVRMVATPGLALTAAADAAKAAGLDAVILGDALEGEAARVGAAMAIDVLKWSARRPSTSWPVVYLSGGETTVTITNGIAGRGGRNTEFLLSAAVQLAASPGVWALAADTDGIDGTEDAAGAMIDPQTLDRAVAAGLDPARMLAGHGSYSLFAATGDLIITGPTHTNVNDFRAVLIG